MKKEEIMNKVSGTFGKIGFKLQKHSPEIFMVVGIIGATATTVVACKATLKAKTVLDETKEKMDGIHESKDKGCTAAGMDYTEENAKKDTTLVYAMRFVGPVRK